MDFSFSEEQEAVRELADRIFTDLSTHERLRELESDPDGDRFDRKLWAELAAAGLLGIALPEDDGGAGLGFVETGLVVEAAGRTAAYVPVIETLAAAAPAIARFGTEAQRQRWLPGVVAGDTVLTTALVELGGTPGGPLGGGRARRRRAGRCRAPSPASPRGWSPTRCWCRPGSSPARWPCSSWRRRRPGVSRERQVANTGQPEAVLTFSGAAGRGRRRCWARSRTARPSSSGWSSGPPRRWPWPRPGPPPPSLALVAEYTKTREQFGKPIATFQAVGQRAADAYVDTEAIRLTAWQAAWRIAEGLPADKEVAIAKFWAADGGQRVVHAAVHLHGGVGVDRDYPLHRYFLMTKHLELTLGGATEQLLVLGCGPGRRAGLNRGPAAMVMGRRPGVKPGLVAHHRHRPVRPGRAADHGAGPGAVPPSLGGRGQPTPQPGRGRDPRDPPVVHGVLVLAPHRRVAVGRAGAGRPVPGGHAPGGALGSTSIPAGGHGGRRPRDLVPPRGDRMPAGTILYLHGGGYIGTSPRMYAAVHLLDVPLAPAARSSSPTPVGPRVPVPGRAGGRRAGPRGAAGRRASTRPGCSWPGTRAAAGWPPR